MNKKKIKWKPMTWEEVTKQFELFSKVFGFKGIKQSKLVVHFIFFLGTASDDYKIVDGEVYKKIKEGK